MKNKLLFSANVTEQDTVSCTQNNVMLEFFYNDELIYKIPVVCLFAKKGRRRIETTLTNLLLDRGVDAAAIENLLKGVTIEDVTSDN